MTTSVTFAKGDLRLEKACSYTVQAANTTMIRLMKCMSCELEDIVATFGHKDTRWYKVKWKGYPLEWERGHILVRDGCTEMIKDFWARSGLNPVKEFYPDPDGRHHCTVCCKSYKRRQDLKAHRTRMRHTESKDEAVTRTAKIDAVVEKQEEGDAEIIVKSDVG